MLHVIPAQVDVTIIEVSLSPEVVDVMEVGIVVQCMGQVLDCLVEVFEYQVRTTSLEQTPQHVATRKPFLDCLIVILDSLVLTIHQVIDLTASEMHVNKFQRLGEAWDLPGDQGVLVCALSERLFNEGKCTLTPSLCLWHVIVLY